MLGTMLPDTIDTGLLTGIFVAIAGGLVQLWVWRIRGRTAEKLKGLDVSSTRDTRALDAEDKAFGYMQQALQDARTELDDERESCKARIAHIRQEADAEVGRLRLAFVAEQSAKLEALEDAFNVRTLAQAQQSRHEAERETILADLQAMTWRIKAAAAWIRTARERMADAGLEVPVAPYWIDESPRMLPPGDAEE